MEAAWYIAVCMQSTEHTCEEVETPCVWYWVQAKAFKEETTAGANQINKETADDRVVTFPM